MNKTLATLAASGAMMLAAQQASAAPIQGAITFSGGAKMNNNNLDLATQVSSFVNPKVQSVSGDFDLFINALDAVSTTAPFVFNSGAHANLFSVGGFQFDLISSTAILHVGGDLLIKGTGTFSGHGFDATVGTFSFTTQEPDAAGVFSFSASSGTPTLSTPDGGATAMLLGIGALGMGVLARRKS